MRIQSIILNLDDGARVEIDPQFVRISGYSSSQVPPTLILTAELVRNIAEISKKID